MSEGRPVVLTALKSGINRLREKGSADPGTLYDLVNGYVDIEGIPTSRPAAVDEVNLPIGTKGLCAFDDAFVVFSHEAKTVPDGYTCEILVHPTAPGTPLLEIHFAAPFLGFLYVVAEFADFTVYHYWLQRRDEWEADHAYQLGDIVEPTTPNGFAYKAHRLNPPGILWAPNVVRAVDDVVEPTTANGFEYHCIDTLGANPRSGTVEPTWPTTEGATVNEDTDLTPPTTPRPGNTDPPDNLPGDVIDRYGDGLRDGFGGLRP